MRQTGLRKKHKTMYILEFLTTDRRLMTTLPEYRICTRHGT